MDNTDITRIRDDIVESALPHVAFDGWSWALVEQACRDAGYEPAMARAVFPGRMKDVLDGFADLADRKMMAGLDDIDPGALRVRERVRTALLARYEFLCPHKEALRESVQFWMVPSRKPRAAKIVWRTADRIWDWAGDTATDYNRYTKRGLLAGILVSATLVFLNDESAHMDNTKAFIDRRIENVLQFGKWINRVKKAS